MADKGDVHAYDLETVIVLQRFLQELKKYHVVYWGANLGELDGTFFDVCR